MARANFGQLLGNVGEKVPPAVPKLDRANLPAGPTAAEPGETVTTSPDASVPIQLRYVRKETRLRGDQQNRLTLEARRLNRAKKNQDARITENSLIRVAIDLLLARIGAAAGDDEDELRKSMAS